MAGVTDYPFRKIVKDFGSGLVCSEMVASRAIIEALKKQAVRERLRFFDSSKEEAPVSIQIVGSDPAIMAEAAKFNEQLGASIIDINMGCPVKKVVNIDCGAALMKNEVLAGNIVRAIVRAVRIPVTVKMRLGWDTQHLNSVNIARIAEAEGASAVTVHGRTRAQFYEGSADWNAIGAVKDAVAIPVIGNGDVKTAQDAEQLMKMCDAVMIGRGACGRPWLLGQIGTELGGAAAEVGGAAAGGATTEGLRQAPDDELQKTTGGYATTENYATAEGNQATTNYLQKGPVINRAILVATIHKHLELIRGTYGDNKGALLARKHLDWYSKGYPGAAAFRATVNTKETFNELITLVNNFFGTEN
jgi:tRNA-dihydrouridine synthase B